MKEKVSIIIPVYNTPEQYLCDCVKSVWSQTYSNIEIILVDDGSASTCAEICNKLVSTYNKKQSEKSITVIHKENEGVSVARNTGIENAKGEFICFVDADDYVHPEFVKILIEVCKKHNSSVACCKYKKVKDWEEFINDINIDEILQDCIYTKGAEVLDYIKDGIVWNKIYRLDSIKNVRFDKNFYFTEDALFWNKVMLEVGECVCTEYVGYFYRINASSSSIRWESEKYRQAIVVLDEILENPYVLENINYATRKKLVREKYRLKFMVAVAAEKEENYIEKLKIERDKFIETLVEIGKCNDKLLSISKIIFKFPMFMILVYLNILRFVHRVILCLKKINSM